VGAVVGSFFAIFWFFFVEWVLSPLLPIIEQFALCQYLYIKDSSPIPNILKFEQENVQNTKRNRKKKARHSNELHRK